MFMIYEQLFYPVTWSVVVNLATTLHERFHLYSYINCFSSIIWTICLSAQRSSPLSVSCQIKEKSDQATWSRSLPVISLSNLGQNTSSSVQETTRNSLEVSFRNCQKYLSYILIWVLWVLNLSLSKPYSRLLTKISCFSWLNAFSSDFNMFLVHFWNSIDVKVW